MKKKILFIGEIENLKKYSDPAVFDRFDITTVPIKTPEEEILRVAGDAVYAIVDAMEPFSANVIGHMPNLKMIHSNGVGYQGIDRAAARARGIDVSNCKGINSAAVAEHALMFMLCLLRDVTEGDRAVREGRQIEVKHGHMRRGDLREMADCTVGLVGFGDIGKALSLLLKPFGARVFYYDPFRASAEIETSHNVTYLPLEELLPACDFISLHLPVFESTKNMADKTFFSKMKKGAYFINTARGELMVSEDLLEALRTGHLAGAAIDTVPGEPVGTDNALLQGDEETMKKLLLSCHIAGLTGATFARGYRMLWENIDRCERGEKPFPIVN